MIKQLWLAFLLITACAGAEAHEAERAARDVIVKWRSIPLRLDAIELFPDYASRVEAVREALPVTSRTEIGLERITVVTAVTADAAAELAQDLRHDSRVEYAELRPVRNIDGSPSHLREEANTLDGVPNDPFYSRQWWLPAIEAEAAWDITRGDPSVVIAVVDLGVDFSHPELTAARWENEIELHGIAGVDDDDNGYIDDFYGWDFMDGDGDPMPSPYEPLQSHGTHISGIAAAARNNGQGIAGLAPDCKIMGVRAGAFPEIYYGYEGIYYACRAGAKVINCSWGGYTESAYEHDIIEYAIEHGSVVVASAGNDNVPEPHFPAGIEGVVGVAATQMTDLAAVFTQYGPWVKIAAPGTYILSTVIGEGGTHDYSSYQGTSMSAPLVAAACAMVAGRFPQMSSRAIAARVVSSADPIDMRNPTRVGELGIGRLNVWRALKDSLPGIRLGEVTYTEISGNGDGRIREGESADLRIAIYNELQSTGDIAGQITLATDEAALQPPTCVYQSVETGGPYWNATALTVTLRPDVPRGFVLPLSIDWIAGDGRVLSRAVTRVLLDSTFTVVDNGYMKLSFAENGCLGYRDYVRNIYLGTGWKLGDHTNALFHGSFMLAADGEVSDNVYGDTLDPRFDWQAAPDSVAHLVPSTRADIEARATFEDRGAETILFARVDVAALAWRQENENKFCILEYTVTNRSMNAWNEAYAGLFLDWDLGAAGLNIAGLDPEAGLAWVNQPAPEHPLVGVASIGDVWSAFYVIDNRVEMERPNAWNDERKWNVLRQGITAPPVEGKDISVQIAVGPLSIGAQARRTFAFALVAGASMEELRAQVQIARQRYIATGAEQNHVETVLPEPDAKLVPNPLPQGEKLRLILPQEEHVTVRIFNLLGQRLTEMRNIKAGPEGVWLEWNIPNRASGLLIYRIESPRKTTTGKLLLLK